MKYSCLDDFPIDLKARLLKLRDYHKWDIDQWIRLPMEELKGASILEAMNNGKEDQVRFIVNDMSHFIDI